MKSVKIELFDSIGYREWRLAREWVAKEIEYQLWRYVPVEQQILYVIRQNILEQLRDNVRHEPT